MENTVTIPLEKYEQMKSEIERLQKENAEKTIIEYVPHWTVRVCFVVVAAAVLICLSFFCTKQINES